MRQSQVHYIIYQFYKPTLLILELSVFLSSLSADNNATLSDFPTMPYLLSVSCKTTILVIPTVAKSAMNRLKLEFIFPPWAVKILGIRFLALCWTIFQPKSFKQLMFSYAAFECFQLGHSITHNLHNEMVSMTRILKSLLKQRLDQQQLFMV